MRKVVLTATALLSAVFLAACGAAALRLGAGADGTKVRVGRGETMVVSLDSNPTTGYDWYVEGALPSQLTTAADEFKSGASSGVVGAGGVRTITYRAVASGTGALRLVYIRPWEVGVAPAKRFTLTVTVP